MTAFDEHAFARVTFSEFDMEIVSVNVDLDTSILTRFESDTLMPPSISWRVVLSKTSSDLIIETFPEI